MIAVKEKQMATMQIHIISNNTSFVEVINHMVDAKTVLLDKSSILIAIYAYHKEKVILLTH